MQLRPLSIGEVLDVAFKLYFRNWAKFVGLVAVVVVPANVISGLVLASAADFAVDGKLYASANSSLTGSRIVIGLVTLIGILLSVAVAYRAVTEAYMGHEPAAGESVRFAFARLFSVLWVSILFVLGVGIGFILLIIPGIYLLVSWSVTLPVLMVEGIKGRKALGRSLSLIDTRWWQTFTILLVLVILISVIPSVIAGLISDAIVGSSSSVGTIVVVTTVVGTIVRIITLPALVAGVTVLYFDLRVRKEGLDMSLMIEQLGFAPPMAPGVVPGAPAAPASPGYGSTSVAPPGYGSVPAVDPPAPAGVPAASPDPAPAPGFAPAGPEAPVAAPPAPDFAPPVAPPPVAAPPPPVAPPPPPPPPAPPPPAAPAPDIGRHIGLPGSSDTGLPDDREPGR
jgi:hypothetical protein